MNPGSFLDTLTWQPIFSIIQKTESTGSILEHLRKTKHKALSRKTEHKALSGTTESKALSGKAESKVSPRQMLQEIPDIKCLFTSEMRASRARQQLK